MRLRVASGNLTSRVDPCGKRDMVTHDEAVHGFEAAYGGVSAVVADLTEGDFFRVTRCRGWTVRDLLYHLLLDAQRALVTLASPDSEPADTDHVSYWRHFTPSDSFRAANVLSVRRSADAYPSSEMLADNWTRTAAAALHLAKQAPDVAVTTQGKVLTLADALRTFAVEATIHHLDLTVDLPAAPSPEPVALRLVRATLDGLLGEPLPVVWDDQTYALKATGRAGLDDEERSALDHLAGRLPLLA